MFLSLLIVLAMGLGLVLFVWAVCTVLPVVNRVATRSFWCRFRTRNVTVELEPLRDSEADGQWETEDILIEPRWVTADAERLLAEELFVDRAPR